MQHSLIEQRFQNVVEIQKCFDEFIASKPISFLAEESDGRPKGGRRL